MTSSKFTDLSILLINKQKDYWYKKTQPLDSGGLVKRHCLYRMADFKNTDCVAVADSKETQPLCKMADADETQPLCSGGLNETQPLQIMADSTVTQPFHAVADSMRHSLFYNSAFKKEKNNLST